MTARPPLIEYFLLCWERLQLIFWNVCWCLRESGWKRSSTQRRPGLSHLFYLRTLDAVIAKPCSLSGLTQYRVTCLCGTVWSWWHGPAACHINLQEPRLFPFCGSTLLMEVRLFPIQLVDGDRDYEKYTSASYLLLPRNYTHHFWPYFGG